MGENNDMKVKRIDFFSTVKDMLEKQIKREYRTGLVPEKEKNRRDPKYGKASISVSQPNSFNKRKKWF